MKKGLGKGLPEAGMAGTEAGKSRPVLSHGSTWRKRPER